MCQLKWKRSPAGKNYHSEDMQHSNCFHYMLSCHLHTQNYLQVYHSNTDIFQGFSSVTILYKYKLSNKVQTEIII